MSPAGESSREVAIAHALYPGMLGPHYATRTLPTTTATVTTTISAAATTSPRDPASLASEQDITASTAARLRALDLDAELTRREWRRRERDLARREVELGAREEEVRRREVWVLDEIRWVGSAGER